MKTFRKRVKNLVESIIGCEIDRIGSRSFAVIDKKSRENDAWFLYSTQIRSIIEKFAINVIIDIGDERQLLFLIGDNYFSL